MKMDILVARQFFADFYFGEHHLPSQIFPFGDGWCVKTSEEFGTFDFDGLTRLFFMAHERCIRVSVMPMSFKLLRLAIHQRDPENVSMMLHHPDLKGAIDRRSEYRAKYDDSFKIAPAQTCTVYTPKAKKQATKGERCPNCDSRDITIFTSDDDLCNYCGKTFPAVISTGRR